MQNEDERLPLGSFICAIDDEGYMTVFREKVVELSDFQADHQPVKTETVYTIGLLDKDFVVNVKAGLLYHQPIRRCMI